MRNSDHLQQMRKCVRKWVVDWIDSLLNWIQWTANGSNGQFLWLKLLNPQKINCFFVFRLIEAILTCKRDDKIDDQEYPEIASGSEVGSKVVRDARKEIREKGKWKKNTDKFNKW